MLIWKTTFPFIAPYRSRLFFFHKKFRAVLYSEILPNWSGGITMKLKAVIFSLVFLFSSCAFAGISGKYNVNGEEQGAQ
jgi:hypothetical protein